MLGISFREVKVETFCEVCCYRPSAASSNTELVNSSPRLAPLPSFQWLPTALGIKAQNSLAHPISFSSPLSASFYTRPWCLQRHPPNCYVPLFSGWLFHCLEHSFCLRKPALSSNYMSHRAMRFVIHHAPVWMECLLGRSSQGFRRLPKEQDLDCFASTVSLALSTLPGTQLYPENLGCLRIMRVNAFFLVLSI